MIENARKNYFIFIIEKILLKIKTVNNLLIVQFSDYRLPYFLRATKITVP